MQFLQHPTLRPGYWGPTTKGKDVKELVKAWDVGASENAGSDCSFVRGITCGLIVPLLRGLMKPSPLLLALQK